MRLVQAHLARKSAVFAAVGVLALGFWAASSAAADGVRYYGSFGHHGGAGTHRGHGGLHGIKFHHGGRHPVVVDFHHAKAQRFRVSPRPRTHHTNVLAAVARHHVPVIIPGRFDHRRHDGHRRGHREDVHGGHQPGHHVADTINPGHKHYGDHAFKAACHPVSKVDHVGHGRKAKIVGTMCYDAHGNPYIVAGSRRIVHYY
jgi:hypothetical protein